MYFGGEETWKPQQTEAINTYALNAISLRRHYAHNYKQGDKTGMT